MKVCKTCGEQKPIEDFPERYGYAGSRRPHCKPCYREYMRLSYHKNKYKHPYNYEKDKNTKLLRSFGISLDDYNSMLVEQNGGCAICGTTDTGKRNAFAVDHCHTTGEVRGLLCQNCNTAIGSLKDDENIMMNAINYIRKHKQ